MKRDSNDQQSGGSTGFILLLVLGSVVLFGCAGLLVFLISSFSSAPEEPVAAPAEVVDVSQSQVSSDLPPDELPTVDASPTATLDAPAVAPAASDAPAVELGIAYGTEKRRWLTEAASRFAKTPDGQKIRIRLLPMGSIEGAHAILDGDQRIHVWCPASSMYRDVFETEWGIRHVGDPIVDEETLALTPMVFVMWHERYDAFAQEYEHLDFRTVAEALHAQGGWSGIADKPNWGLFKFGHTHPLRSNSGLQALVLMAYDFHQKSAQLTVGNIVSPEFQSWLGTLESGVSGLTDSTGDLMKEMVLKGPSAFDSVMVYESVAIDYLKNAEGRWGRLQVVYPDRNMWNDNPYYTLDTPWITPDHQQAAEIVLRFLMSEPIQQLALTHGFRPGNPEVPVKFPESPFMTYEKYGLRIDLPAVCEPPSPQVINNLQQSWQRRTGSR